MSGEWLQTVEESKLFLDRVAEDAATLLQETVQTYNGATMRKESQTESSQKSGSYTGIGHPQSFRCDDCSKRFTCSSSLIKHQRIHTGETPFRCSGCGKSFNQQSSLRAHQRIHTNDRRYACQYCKRKFIQKTSLLVHSQTHTGVKLWECSECGTRFSGSSELYHHQVNIHNKPQPHKCDQCNRAFVHETRLRQHKQKKHRHSEKPHYRSESVSQYNTTHAIQCEPTGLV